MASTGEQDVETSSATATATASQPQPQHHRPQHAEPLTACVSSAGGGRTETVSQSRKSLPPSQAKRRLEAMAANIDHKLAGAFTVILLLYACITFGTWMRIESQYVSNPITQAVTLTDPAVSTTAARLIFTEANNNRRPAIRLQDIHDIATLQLSFPIHAGDDMEAIDHPGMKLATPASMAKIKLDHPEELPADGKMQVPTFWRPSVYGDGGVRQFLGHHGQRLISPEEAAQIGSIDPVTGQETIYISVASYRDPECQPTVEDMFLRAEHPERLRVAIIDQRAPNDPVPPCGDPIKPCSQDPDQALCRFHHLIDVFEVPAPLSIGPVFARHLANRMYRGEYFAMQVDSHVRFIHHWDSDIVGQWKSAKNEMGILSVYLSDIIGSIDPVTYENKHPSRPIMCKTDFEGRGKMRHLRHGQQPEGVPGIHGEPTLHPFWAAGFSFARGHFVVQVPYDQYSPMVFQGEEISMGLRGFTYGYDYYTPETSVAFHMYAIKENKEKRKNIKLFWENSNFYPGSAVEGMKRLNTIIGMGEPEDEGHIFDVDADEYGLGQVRPKEKFFSLYGIHTDTLKVEDHLCQFVGKPMMKIFIPHLRANGMGIDYSDLEYEFKDPKPAKEAKTKA